MRCRSLAGIPSLLVLHADGHLKTPVRLGEHLWSLHLLPSEQKQSEGPKPPWFLSCLCLGQHEGIHQVVLVLNS